MKKILFASLLVISLTGCVTASKVDTLIPQSVVNVPTSSKLNQAVTVSALSNDYGGAFKGQVSNEALSSALKDALGQSGMLANSDAKYTVVPSLVHLKQPAIGVDMKVTAKANYLVKDSDGKIVWEKTISTPYTAKFSEAFVGATRVKRANEGAVRANIAQFIQDLVAWSEEANALVSDQDTFSVNL